MKANQRGLTLIEVIIGLLIFMLVMVLFVNIMMTATGISRKANEIAKESMAEIFIMDQGTGVPVKGLPNKIILGFDNGKKVTLEGTYKESDEQASKYIYFDTTKTSQIP